MAVQKPSIPKGTRDFSPAEMIRRNYLFDTIRGVFHDYGFLPLETPAMENLSTLMGKYGEEGDKLLFKVLNSGDFMEGIDPAEHSPAVLAARICEKGLRYDLTVPFARYVVQHQSDIVFPFRRYQMQPVWRADRPQKGRYREFYQCDVDIIGSRSIVNEAELVQIVEAVFGKLGIAVTLKVNNRKILYAIAELIGAEDKVIDITVAIDKLDKIGMNAVREELEMKGIPAEAFEKLKPILELSGSNEQKINSLKSTFSASEIGCKGIGEMEAMLRYAAALGTTLDVEIDLSLARGLNYYTGAIFEVKARDYAIGSICGGGRYDDLTGIFGLPDTSGVGISFGADRIYDVMAALDLFPADAELSTRLILLNFGGEEEICSLKVLAGLRKKGIVCEIYPDAAKMKKQMDYANRRAIPYVAIIGSDEMAKGVTTLKNMATGQQQTLPFDQIAGALQ